MGDVGAAGGPQVSTANNEDVNGDFSIGDSFSQQYDDLFENLEPFNQNVDRTQKLADDFAPIASALARGATTVSENVSANPDATITEALAGVSDEDLAIIAARFGVDVSAFTDEESNVTDREGLIAAIEAEGASKQPNPITDGAGLNEWLSGENLEAAAHLTDLETDLSLALELQSQAVGIIISIMQTIHQTAQTIVADT
jgi:hypothetical protein